MAKGSLEDRAKQGSNALVKSSGDPKTIDEYFDVHETDFMNLLPPKRRDPDWRKRTLAKVLNVVMRNPNLMTCNIPSLANAMFECAVLQLSPGPLGEIYLVPFGGNVTVIIGYQGLMKLIRNAGGIAEIKAFPVYKGEKFEVSLGTDPKVVHEPDFTLPRNDRDLGQVYSVAWFTDGRKPSFHVMTREECEAHRKRSRSSGNGPWQTDYVAMCLKTCIRSHAKWLPKSSEDEAEILAEAITIDEREMAAPDFIGGNRIIDVESTSDPQPEKDAQSKTEKPLDQPTAEKKPTKTDRDWTRINAARNALGWTRQQLADAILQDYGVKADELSDGQFAELEQYMEDSAAQEATYEGSGRDATPKKGNEGGGTSDEQEGASESATGGHAKLVAEVNRLTKLIDPETTDDLIKGRMIATIEDQELQNIIRSMKKAVPPPEV